MFSSILYQLLLQPLETIYGAVFEFCQHLCSGRILPALLLLSLLSSLVLTAVERKAAKYINKEKLIQGVLSKQLVKIKAQYQGEKRQEKIKALYKRYSYNPLLSIRSSLGVLSQLPFLLGAYFMLLHDESLKGVSIGRIADISAPDALLWGVNLLPIAMLCINILNALLSTWLTNKEKLTSVVIGGVFFVLLYAAPACMLIYWTTNNTIQLLKTAGKCLYHSKNNVISSLVKDKKQKIAALIKGKFNLSEQERVRNALRSYPVILSLLVLAILSIFWFSMHYAEKMTKYCHFDAQDPNCSESLMVLLFDKHGFVQFCSYSFSVALFTVFIILIKDSVARFFNNGIDRYGVKQFILRILIGGVAFIGVVIYLCRHASTMYSAPGCVGLIFVFATLIIIQWKNKKELLQQIKPDEITLNNSKALFVPAVLVLSGLIAVYAPTMLFLSDPQALGVSFDKFTIQNLQFLLVIFVVSALGYYIATNRIRILLTASVVVLSVLSIVYCLILIPDLGAIQSFKFDRPNILKSGVFINQDIAIFALISLSIYLLYRFKRIKLIGVTLLVFCAYIYCYPVMLYKQNAGVIEEITKKLSDTSKPLEEIPENIKQFFTFSEKDNILVIAMDAFTGGNMRELVEKHQDLKKDLEGFIWFEDTVTAGQSTDRGIQGCLGGEVVDPVRFQHDNGLSNWERINQAWSIFLNYLINKGYDVNVHEPIWLRADILDRYLKKNTQHRFLTGYAWDRGLWDQNSQLKTYSRIFNRNVDDAIVEYSPKFIRWYGVYSILPNTLKKKIYKNGRWKNSVAPKQVDIMIKTLEYSNSELLPHISSVQKNINPQYKFIHLAATHGVFNMDDDCNVTSRFWHEMNSDNTIRGHLNTEYCSLKSLARFFKWMKKEGIYNKTQIILVSDHGEHFVQPVTDDSRLTANGIGLEGPSKFFPHHNASYALLMVKERNSTSEYQVNSKYLMRNLDSALLVKHGLGDEVDYEPYKDMNRIRINVQGNWNQAGNVEYNTGAFVVRGSMFNKENWTKVIEPDEIKNLGGLLYDEK